VYWVKVTNWIENVTNINRSKLLSRCDRLPLLSQALSVVMYFQLVTEWSRSFFRISHRLVYSSRTTRCKETEGSL